MKPVVVVLLVCAILAGPAVAETQAPLIRTLMPDPQTTSWNKSSIGPRIIMGYTAPKNAYPYQVGMEVHISGGSTWCGGAILSSKYVLTAAHCIQPAFSVRIYFGAHDRRNAAEPGQVRKFVDKSYFKIHNQWSANTLMNDIALIELPTEIALSAHIRPIQLPPRGIQHVTFEGSPAIATGWGYTAGQTSLAQYLQNVDVNIQTPIVCASFMSPWVRSTNICVDGSNGKGACFGDSGGPLVWTGGVRYLIGVASFIGYFGCESNYPSVYTRVTSYLDWISANSGIKIA